MKNTLFALLLLSLMVSGNIHAATAVKTNSQPIPEIELAPPGGDFTLHSATGPVALKEFRGKAVFLYFGYTNCPECCTSGGEAGVSVFDSLLATRVGGLSWRTTLPEVAGSVVLQDDTELVSSL